jgi:hypothetical protein
MVAVNEHRRQTQRKSRQAKAKAKGVLRGLFRGGDRLKLAALATRVAEIRQIGRTSLFSSAEWGAYDVMCDRLRRACEKSARSPLHGSNVSAVG